MNIAENGAEIQAMIDNYFQTFAERNQKKGYNMKMLSAKEVADILGCDVSTVRVNARKGAFAVPSIRVGKLYKFRDEDVYEYAYGKNWKGQVSDENRANA